MVRKCNVRDHTIERAAYQSEVPMLVEIVKAFGREVMQKFVDGETMNFTSKHGMVMKNFMTRLTGEQPWTVDLGEEANITLPRGFCPTGTCGEEVGVTAYRWPHLTYCHPKSEEKMAPDTRVIAMDLMTKSLAEIVVKKLENPIVIYIPRTPIPEKVNAAKARSTILPVVYSNFNVSHNGSSLNLEITPAGPSERLFLVLAKARIPTLERHDWSALVKDLPKRNDTYEWFFSNADLKGEGSYFLGVGEFKAGFDPAAFLRDPESSGATKAHLKNISVAYEIRIYTSGCYFYNEDLGEWMADGILASFSDLRVSRCESRHLTQFGAGFFVLPNSIDFSYTFAKIGFHDNVTIYATLIVLWVIFVVLMLGATPLPDNRVEDKYLYEILVFTGNKKEAQTDSTVQFIVSGDRDESEVRTFGDEKRRIFRKGGIDVFVMAESRPLGKLSMLRIWHDNSGRGPNASWYLSYIVFRDVQTGEKYAFIANQWFAVECEDGQIDRTLTVAGKGERRLFLHLYHNTSSRGIVDGHLWFSRLGSCFSLLFLSMLVNAMWYQRVPEKPGLGSFEYGPFSMSTEQIGVGVVSNLIVFPPTLLIVFLFRKSRPKVLRKSRILKAVEEMRSKAKAEGALASDCESNDSLLHHKFIQKKDTFSPLHTNPPTQPFHTTSPPPFPTTLHIFSVLSLPHDERK
ncbi:putative pkd1l2 [Penaeus vannamei]|uniref:Putative pkd1l2 n=1 Tax=Penaeus vannamei TaxID=6689 RepID=A0A423SVT0_PENVA|nr:putative pkd1l2 [Penaeus vannamei]